MKRILLSMILLFLSAAMLRAETTALFTSVTGKVQVKGPKTKKARLAEKGATVAQGDRIITGPSDQAVLKAFDGSELRVSPNTDFTVEKLEQTGQKDKTLQFKLAVGKLWAKVTKLFSSSSSFEIEAGGVVCGVRGTEYSMFYDPATGKVDVVVYDGTVWTTSNGQTQEFHGGQGGTFQGGNWTPHPPPTSNVPGLGFVTSNPFYGFNGTGQDDFNIPLTDLPGGLPGLTGQVGSTGVAGLGNHVLLDLQLKFPQYPPGYVAPTVLFR
jgi:hypothetical protein